MKFDFIIGNPPYQDDANTEAKSTEETKKTLPSVYNYFIDAAYEVADKVMLIHPARFLYNAGNTPKDWNQKILNDQSFKILYHEVDSTKIFADQAIMGGVVISYRDKNKNFGAIGVYSSQNELKTIMQKVINNRFQSFSEIVYSQGLYRFSAKMYAEYPQLMKKFADPRITASSFSRIPDMFTQDKPKNQYEYSLFLGLLDMKRVWRWFRNDYFYQVENYSNYKVIIPKANGSPSLGSGNITQLIGKPLVGKPFIAHTKSFLSIGNFVTEDEANSCLKYICSKFCRTMLGTLKITQNNPPPIWKNVPLQDFTKNSDIDWTKSIPEIDQQLYAKYGLDPNEIEFIETHVREMA